MTGFGASSKESGSLRVDVEVRSVNHRFLKIQSRLPPSLALLEADMEAAIRRRLRRGSVNLAVRVAPDLSSGTQRIDGEAARGYMQAIRELAREIGMESDGLSLDTILTLPGVLGRSESLEIAAEGDPLRDLVMETIDAALDSLDASRAVEGEHLRNVLGGHLRVFREHLDAVAERAPQVPRELRDKSVDRVRALLDDLGEALPGDEAGLLREICAIADRTDIAEEIHRLESHLQQLDALLLDGKEAGRRIEFLLQEMQREVNTIGSKANDASIAHRVVEMKVEVERMKEQVQNLE